MADFADIKKQYIGKTINKNILHELLCPNGMGYGDFADCQEYYISSIDYQDDESLSALFGVSEHMTENSVKGTHTENFSDDEDGSEDSEEDPEDKYVHKDFSTSDTILDYWLYDGIYFSVYFYLKDGIIKDLEILKYKETYIGHGRPQGYYLTPFEQEIEVAVRIIEYCSEM